MESNFRCPVNEAWLDFQGLGPARNSFPPTRRFSDAHFAY